jgi:hypothetical protein
VKSAFWRGIIRQALFYVLCLLAIFIATPLLNRNIRFHGGWGSILNFLLFCIGFLFLLGNLTILIFKYSYQVNKGSLLVNALYLGGAVLTWLTKVY